MTGQLSIHREGAIAVRTLKGLRRAGLINMPLEVSIQGLNVFEATVTDATWE